MHLLSMHVSFKLLPSSRNSFYCHIESVNFVSRQYYYSGISFSLMGFLSYLKTNVKE